MATTETAATPRLKARYREEILPALREEFGFQNVMQVPGVTKSRPDGSTYPAHRSVRIATKTGKEF
jgi:hypothetical protein